MSPRAKAKACRDCNAKASDGVYLSKRGLCLDCGHKRWADNVAAMQADPDAHRERCRAGLQRFVNG